jgi:hypothetical protein
MFIRAVTGILIILIGTPIHQAAAQEVRRYVPPALASDAEPTFRVAPSPLFAVEENRASIVEGILVSWRASLAKAYGNATPEQEAQLRSSLMALRADKLLSASLAGTLDGLSKALSEPGPAIGRPASLVIGEAMTKHLGDVGIDVVFTPVTPCRIADTRSAGGQLQAGVPRTFIGFNATTFATQGGVASNCGIPSGVAALVLNIAAVQPAAAGFLRLWPANAAMPLASMVNFAVGDFATATGTVVPVDPAANNQFNVWTPANVDFVADVAGYFIRPQATGLECTTTAFSSLALAANAAGNLDSPNCPAGYTVTGGECSMMGDGWINASFRVSGQNGWICFGHALAAVSDVVSAAAQCCRVPGR